MSPPQEGRRGISATTLAAHHHLQCDLFLYNSYHNRGSLQAGAKQPVSELLKATFSRGEHWEATLLNWLDAQNLLLKVTGSVLEGQDVQEVIEIDERDHFFVTGLVLKPPDAAFKAFFRANGHNPVQFSIAKPDLLEVRKEKDGTIRWQVIDAKSSSNVKTSHHVQIYFYHIFLEHLLTAPWYSSLGTAGIWLPPSLYAQAEPSFETLKTISTSLLSLPLDGYLFEKLPYVLSLDRSEVQWHFNPLCKGCNFRSTCSTNAVQRGKLGAMANISHHEADILRSLLSISRSHGCSEESTDIEDLHSAVVSGKRASFIERHHSSSLKAAKRILKAQGHFSPIIEAARLGVVQPLNKRVHTLPSMEDIAVVMSFVLDPFSGAILAYTITTYSNLESAASFGHLMGTADDFITALSSVVQYILDLNEVRSAPPLTQFYVFSAAERVSLQRVLIDASLTGVYNDEELGAYPAQLCVGALCEGAALLATSLQPLVLSGALLGFLSKKNGRKKEELRMCLSRLGLPGKDLSQEEMRRKIVQELERLRKQDKGTNRDNVPEIGQLPRVVVLKSELERLLALPVPETICPTDEDIFAMFTPDKKTEYEKMLRLRNDCIYEVLQHARDAVKPNILVNEARVLTSEFMDICKEEHLRKLFFMQQFEVLTRLGALWRDRIDGCGEAPRLQYIHTNRLQDNSYIHQFELVSGYVDSPSDRERTFYGYILAEDDDTDIELPVEALFDDLAVFNVLFPLNKFTRYKWMQQPDLVQQKLFVADIYDIVIRDFQTFVILRTYGHTELRLKKRMTYRLSPRLVDFNITKVLSTLVDLDFQTPSVPGYMSLPSFLQLFSDPRAFAKQASESFSVVQQLIEDEKVIHKRLYELSELTSAAKLLLLEPSQRQAFRRVLKYRLSVIWGPPGTGKTHTLALSLLRLAESRSMRQVDGPYYILLTAVTHAAIQACISKLRELMGLYRQFPGMKLDWLDNIRLELVQSGALHPLPEDNNATHIYAGTVYQLYNFCNKTSISANCVVIDEAGQLGLGPSSLVLKSLRGDGRVIVAGDSEQLAPILASEYPQTGPRLFGSILDSLMPLAIQEDERSKTLIQGTLTDASDLSMIVQLTENFRLNADLGAFVSLIYKRSFTAKSHKILAFSDELERQATLGDVDSTYRQAKEILIALFRAVGRKKQTVFTAPIVRSSSLTDNLAAQSASLALVRMTMTSANPGQASYEQHVRGGAYFTAALAKLILCAAPDKTTLFVATPHRIQRQAVRDALRTHVDELAEAFGSLQINTSSDEGKNERDAPPNDVRQNITVDTVERLQGSEADVVICLFAHTYPGNASTAIDFLLQRRRLNVAISRAKTLCILIASREVLRPPVRIFANPQSAKGFAFLRAYEERAWTTTATVDLDELDVN